MKNSQQATYVYFAVALVILLAGAAFVFSLSYTKDALRAKYLGHLSELRVLSQQIATNATEAANGKSDAFSRLESARFGFDTRWLKIRNGDPQEGLSPESEFVTKNEPTVEELQSIWQQVSNSADSILNSETDVLELHALVKKLNDVIPALLTESESVVDTLVQSVRRQIR